MKFKNIILCFLIYFLLFFNINTVQTENSDFIDSLSDSQRSILEISENSSKLEILEYACTFKAEGFEQDNCFEQVQLAQILMIDDSSFCSELNNLKDGCYFEFASRDGNVAMCDFIDDNNEKNECIGDVIKNNAMQGNDINLCDSLLDPYRESCIESVLSIQNNVSFCSTIFITSNNLVDKCMSIVLSGYAMTSDNSIHCEAIPLQSYQEICFIELGFYCEDNVCTNVFEDIYNCPQDCIVCGDNSCTVGHEDINNCPQDCIVCGDNSCTVGHEDINTCPEDCYICGDGVTTLPSEACDDGENNGEYGYCKLDCSGLGDYCGDEKVNTPPEVCEQSQGPLPCVINEYNGNQTCNSDCLGLSECIAVESCGDGTVNTPEQCDDNNLNDNDGCSPQCTIETGWSCAGEPSACNSLCGDGNIVGSEQCDDGNIDSGDGCSPQCTIETGWSCAGEPSACNSLCGDGNISIEEQCDDSNQDSGDGCSPQCTIETGWSCAGEPSGCIPNCGDNNTIGNETCDDGNLIDYDGCSSVCQNETYNLDWCGDNILFLGIEMCDDGNTNNNDSCLDTCIYASCGDGYIQSGEICDDNNQDNGDGCDFRCEVEIGWDCNDAEPSVCVETCGNGILDLGEMCDDGNTNNNDSCLDTCVDASCGDGYIQFDTEQCDPSNPVYGSNCDAKCNLISNCNTEYCALSELFTSTNGQNWTNNTNWLSNLPLNQWQGITTDVNGNVEGITLGLNMLVGSIPSEISNLTNLRYLSLNGNEISNINAISGLSGLLSLNLGDNFPKFSSSDVSFLNNFTNLNLLWLYENNISDVSIFKGLTNLVSLRLENNNISNISTLGDLINLQYLNLRDNNIDGIPNNICDNLNNLNTLHLHDNNLGIESCAIMQCLDDKSIADFVYNPQQSGSFNYFDNCVEVCNDGIIWGYEECEPEGLTLEETNILQQQKLTDISSTGGDYFGHSVSINGNYMVIGAYGDDDQGSNSGSAYVFKYNGSNWIQEAKLTANDGDAYDIFGHSVAIDGDYMVIGAHGDNGDGSAYIFKYNGKTWLQEQKLIDTNKIDRDWFGHSVAINGDYIIIGAYGDNNGDDTDSGSVYIFKRDNITDTWLLEQKLVASDKTAYDYFGYSITIDGDYIVIGAYLDDDQGSNSGSAYVFKYNGSNWIQEAKLTASDGVSNDRFANSVAIDGNYIVISAHLDDDQGGNSGSVYVFKYNGSNWIQEAKLTASDGVSNDYFGRYVAVDGNYIIIGAYLDDNDDTDSGSAYVFKYNGSNWIQEAKLTASDGANYDHFGKPVVAGGDYMIIGAPQSDNDKGSVYVFRSGCLKADGSIGIMTCDSKCMWECQ